MSRDLEADLIAELEAVGAAVGVPGVDLAGVRRSARHERRRRVGLGAGAASLAVVVALVGALWLLPGSTGSRAVDPVGSAGSASDGLGVPWVDVDDVVHLPSGAEVSLPGVSGVFSRGGTTVAVVGEELLLLGDDGSTTLLEDTGESDVRPVLSSDGGWLAYAPSRPALSGVVRLETGGGGRSSVGVQPPFGVMDVGDDGSVLLGIAADAPLEVIPPDQAGADLGPLTLAGQAAPTSGELLPDGRLVGYALGGTTTVFGLDRDGQVTAEGQLPDHAVGGSWAPDASAYVRVDGGSLVVQQLDPDLRPTTSASLGLPNVVNVAGWTESGDVVLITLVDLTAATDPAVRRCTRAGVCTAIDLPGLAYVATN